MKVVVEVIYATIKENFLKYKYSYFNISDTGINPDDTVNTDLEKFNLQKKCIVHSTSWRYKQKAIILTYLVFITDNKLRFKFKYKFSTNYAPKLTYANTTEPRPKRILRKQVVNHAISHLHELLHKEEFKKTSNTLDKSILEIIENFNTLPFKEFD